LIPRAAALPAEGGQQISPGQSDTAKPRAPPWGGIVSNGSPERAKQKSQRGSPRGVVVPPFQGLAPSLGPATQGGAASVAVPLCPGLMCSCPCGKGLYRDFRFQGNPSATFDRPRPSPRHAPVADAASVRTIARSVRNVAPAGAAASGGVREMRFHAARGPRPPRRSAGGGAGAASRRSRRRGRMRDDHAAMRVL
jgi:hypothetical protein